MGEAACREASLRWHRPRDVPARGRHGRAPARIPGAADQVDTEKRWLPHLAPHLPLQVPVPLGRGVPGQGFPMPWSVYAWLDGENAFDRPIVDLRDAAIELGCFVAALRRVDATGGPQSFRGGPVSTSGYDVRTPIRDPRLRPDTRLVSVRRRYPGAVPRGGRR